MSENRIFVKTAKAERKGAKLSGDLKRLLSYIDDKSRSGELAKRAPPSLRNIWDELLNELVKRGYIAENPNADPDRTARLPKFVPGDRPVTASSNSLDYSNMSAVARAAAERAKQAEQQAARVRAEQAAAMKTEEGLDHLEAGVLGVCPGIEEGEQTFAPIVDSHDGIVQQGVRYRDEAEQVGDTGAGEEQHEQGQESDEDRGAEIGL